MKRTDEVNKIDAFGKTDERPAQSPRPSTSERLKGNAPGTSDNANMKYQDSMFRDLFRDKNNFLELYQTIHPEDISVTADDLEWIALENVFAVRLYNDVSYFVRGKLMLFFEHQSTIDRNIPLRLLEYFVDAVNRYMSKRDFDLHQKSLIKLPAVEFYLVYSGESEWEADELRLSDSFTEDTDALELTVKIIHRKEENVHNIVNDYLTFIHMVKTFMEKHDNSNEGKYMAISEAISYCIANGILTEYLMKRKGEVFNMLTKEITQEEHDRIVKKDGAALDRARINELIRLLMQDKRMDDLIRSTSDPDFQEQLLKEYRL